MGSAMDDTTQAHFDRINKIANWVEQGTPAGPVPGQIAMVRVLGADGGFELVIENEDLPPETLADLLREAADKIEGKSDRATGCWGR